jgi:hypothetical protein
MEGRYKITSYILAHPVPFVNLASRKTPHFLRKKPFTDGPGFCIIEDIDLTRPTAEQKEQKKRA